MLAKQINNAYSVKVTGEADSVELLRQALPLGIVQRAIYSDTEMTVAFETPKNLTGTLTRLIQEIEGINTASIQVYREGSGWNIYSYSNLEWHKH